MKTQGDTGEIRAPSEESRDILKTVVCPLFPTADSLKANFCPFHKLLIYINALYLYLISYIVVNASAVQQVEMTIKKFSPVLFRTLGIYLPLITTNCAILGRSYIRPAACEDW